MVKTENSNNARCPDSITLEDNTIVPWDQATIEMQTQWLEENRSGHTPGSYPDKGNGKEKRKKQRRTRYHS
jgi:hypothetical protein